MEQEHDSFQQLVRALRDGDDAAWSAVFEEHFSGVLAYVDRNLPECLQTRLDPDDVVQSVFKSFFRKLQAGNNAISDANHLRALLFASARVKLIEKHRDHRRAKRDPRREIPLSSSHSGAATNRLDPIGSGPMAEEVAEQNDLLDAIRSEIASFSELDQRIVALKLEGMSTSEIASVLGRGETTVADRYKRMLSLLRTKLQ